MRTKSQIIGGNFEGEITLVCNHYKQLGFASIDKTPEPVKQIGKMDERGRFTACYTKKAQPDFKGVSAKVDYYLSLYDRNVTWLAKALSVSQATLYKKLKHPEKITLGDIKDISEVFKVDMREFGVIV